jgi:hypothetical protein
MSTIAATPRHARVKPRATLSPLTRRLVDWLSCHARSLIYALPILAACSVIRVWNLTGTPGGSNDDEGTYVSQAWAILNDHALAHYTYWYDHPPFGWMQIAGWAWLTDGFHRTGTAIIVGRELVTVYAIIGGGLIYLLCRQFDMQRFFSVLGMVLFMLCPITQSYGRMVYLDTIAVPWVLAALLFAARTKRGHGAALAAGIFLAGAALTKETMFVFAPVVGWIIWQQSPKSLRLKNLVMSMAMTFCLGIFYFLMAFLKGELLPGAGHVSLGSSLAWQLSGRDSTGSILNPHSLSHQWFVRWLELDWYLLAASVPMLFIVLFRRELWPIAAAAFIHIGLLLRNGYLPIPFVVILIPIAALLVAGGLDVLWRGWKRSALVTYAFRGVAAILTVAFVVIATPGWYQNTVSSMTNDDMLSERQSVNWIVNNVPVAQHAQIIVDDNIWPDLIERGYARNTVDWLYKPDADPAITPRYIPKGTTGADSWKNVDYVIIPPLPQTIIDTLPIVKIALSHSTIVAKYDKVDSGSYTIYKVNHPVKQKATVPVKSTPRRDHVRRNSASCHPRLRRSGQCS